MAKLNADGSIQVTVTFNLADRAVIEAESNRLYTTPVQLLRSVWLKYLDGHRIGCSCDTCKGVGLLEDKVKTLEDKVKLLRGEAEYVSDNGVLRIVDIQGGDNGTS